MKLGAPTPWWGARDLPITNLQKEIERLFDDFTRGMSGLPAAAWRTDTFVPRVDLAEDKDGLKVTAELPGIDAKDVECTLDEGVLTIKGEKKSEKKQEDKEKGYYMEERSYGSFYRAIPLPYAVDEDKVQAAYDKGVLTIQLPKAPEVKSKEKKIAIGSFQSANAAAEKKVA